MSAETFAELTEAWAQVMNEQLAAAPLAGVLEELDLGFPLRKAIERETRGIRNLGQLFASDDVGWRLERTVSRGQLRRFVALLAEWLLGAADFDSATVKLETAGDPSMPRGRSDLERWALAHGVADCAATALSDVPDGIFPKATQMFRTPQRSVAGAFDWDYAVDKHGNALRAALWGWLQSEARDVEEARKRGPVRHPRPTDPQLAELYERLVAARAPMDFEFPSRPRPAHFRIELREDPLSVVLELSTLESWGHHWPSTTKVEVPLPRSGEVVTKCTCMQRTCAHRSLALDVLMRELSAPDGLGAGIRRELSAPLWQKALAFERKSDEKAPAPHELSFFVRIGEHTASVITSARRIGKKGPSTSARDVKAVTALAYPGLPDADRRVLEQLALYEPEYSYGDGDPNFLALALLALDGHPRVFDRDDRRPLVVRQGRMGVHFEDGAAGQRPVFTIGGVLFEFPNALLLPCHGDRVVAVRLGDTLWLARLDEAALTFIAGVVRYQAAFPPEAYDAVVTRLEKLKRLDVALPEAMAGLQVPFEPRAVVRVEPVGSEGLEVNVRVRPAEGAEPLAPGIGSDRFVFRHEEQRRFVMRDRAAEEAVAAPVVAQLELPAASHEVVDPERAIALVDRLEDLARAGLDVEWPATRWRLTRPAKTSDVKMEVKRGRDWFGLDGTVDVDGEQVRLAVLLDSVRRRRKWIRLKDRQWLRLSQDLMDKLQSLSHVASEGADGLEVTWAALPALEQLQGQLEQLEMAKEFSTMLDRVRDAEKLQPKVPAELKAELRDYQRQGFEWMSRLAAWGAGCCLADDMGLGKTVQSLALLLSRASEGPALVVAPTSVTFNWKEEAAKFAPGLQVHEYRTSDRAGLLEKLGPSDVVLTSWGLLARDAEVFAKVSFATVVLDEAQAMKNASTLRAKAARGLKAGFKLALSGTPLENHLGELWSLYRVVLPGLFGSLEQFRARFALPIERDNDAAARAALAAVVRPFLLRRNKTEVAKELPARTELMLHVELSEEEKKLYDDARLAAVSQLKGGDLPQEKKRFQVLAALTRLRQIACHPRLYDEQWSGPASKLARLMELLTDLREGGHRALVFSQFTSHLALVRDAVTAAGFSFQYLDGATPAAARQQRVEAFQRGEGQLFLISLKAGGVGLNLTAADYVVHLDPWWNPAVEDQATDRAHRIGQQKPVTVYRLISAGTVEDGIVSLHAEKRDLVAGVLEGSGAAGALSTEELVALIRGGG